VFTRTNGKSKKRNFKQSYSVVISYNFLFKWSVERVWSLGYATDVVKCFCFATFCYFVVYVGDSGFAWKSK